MTLELVKCLACSLVYAPETVAPEELAGLYTAAEYDTSEEAGYAAQTYARELEAIPGFALVPRLGAIDIGAGNGQQSREYPDYTPGRQSHRLGVSSLAQGVALANGAPDRVAVRLPG